MSDGGPAFPHLHTACQRINETEYFEGLTKREWFAAHAPKEIPDWFAFRCPEAENMTARGFPQGAKQLFDEKRYFSWRYFYADAMLAEAAKVGEEER